MKQSVLISIVGGLLGITICSGLALSSAKTYADNNTVVDDVSIEVPAACSMSGTVVDNHTATLLPGTYSAESGSEYESGIGTTTLTTFCNDNNGFSIYAVGFTGETEGDNTLVGTSVSGNATINTKVYESTDTISNWSMKVTKVDDSTQAFNPANMSIVNSFNNWHTVPDDYTKVAEYHASTGSSATDATIGAKVQTTYAAFISTIQPADTYTGKVKYVMVHPYDHASPVIEVPGVYTLSRRDGDESATQIGQAISNDTATYDSPDEVMDAWEDVWNEPQKYSFYLKHTVVNDIITESYVGFTITPEDVADYEGMIPGNYALRGGVDESNSQEKTIFIANMNLLKTVHDYANHPDRCEGDSDYFSCTSTAGQLYVNSNGEITAFGGGGMHCNVLDSGDSSCEWQ